ncbi:hypothetical protein [Paludibacterium denitrificans]|uniref:Uncharacterized protein n=1 Tax=Paludibacterium denitrificans TaxID=2675226 RepID=A0A844GE44_9NEIS|nr:hypothetical protein [Paludibacterium denitrificans]MTD33488.1 hypothetical protein [Paludibacterium denitrificans]
MPVVILPRRVRKIRAIELCAGNKLDNVVNKKIIEVVAGVLMRPDGSFMLGS